jgi:hypothetical protein
MEGLTWHLAGEVIIVGMILYTVRSTNGEVFENRRKLNDLQRTSEQIHGLVNSAMGKILKLYAGTARELANKTHDHVHEVAADLAEKNLQEHNANEHMGENA